MTLPPRLQQIYNAVAEYPGVKVTAPEIALEVGLDPKAVGMHLVRLADMGALHRQSRGRGHGRAALYWVDAEDEWENITEPFAFCAGTIPVPCRRHRKTGELSYNLAVAQVMQALSRLGATDG